MVVISGLTFAATPGYTYKISFSTDGIDKTKQSNKEFMAEENTSDIEFGMSIELRECAVGE